jgi:hypothetical protein
MKKSIKYFVYKYIIIHENIWKYRNVEYKNWKNCQIKKFD